MTTTGVTSSNTPLSTLEQHKAQNLLDTLLLLYRSPPYIHKLQLRLSIDTKYYNDIQRDFSRYNREKKHDVDYCLILQDILCAHDSLYVMTTKIVSWSSFGPDRIRRLDRSRLRWE